MTGFESKVNLNLSVDADLYHYFMKLNRTLPLNFGDHDDGHRCRSSRNLSEILENVFIDEIVGFLYEQIRDEAYNRLPNNVFERYKYLMECIRDSEPLQRLRFKIPDIGERIRQLVQKDLAAAGVNIDRIRKFLSEEELEELNLSFSA